MTASGEAQIIGAAKWVLTIVGGIVTTLCASLFLWGFSEIVTMGRNQSTMIENIADLRADVRRLERLLTKREY